MQAAADTFARTSRTTPLLIDISTRRSQFARGRSWINWVTVWHRCAIFASRRSLPPPLPPLNRPPPWRNSSRVCAIRTGGLRKGLEKGLTTTSLYVVACFRRSLSSIESISVRSASMCFERRQYTLLNVPIFPIIDRCRACIARLNVELRRGTCCSPHPPPPPRPC